MTRRFPHVLTILSVFMVIFAVMTWVVPAGEYQRQLEGSRQVVVPGTYGPAEPAGQGVLEVLMAPARGFEAASGVIGFVFLVAGAFGIVYRTGAIEAFLALVIRGSRRHPGLRWLVIPGLMGLFSLAGATFGMSEEVLVFLMLTMPLARALNYDVVVGVAIPFLGAGAGFAAAFINPFTVGVAQGIAGLPPGSGLGYRLLCWTIITTLATAFVMAYAYRVDRDPRQSLMPDTLPDLSSEQKAEQPEMEPPTPAQWSVLAVLCGGLGLLLVGVQAWDWYIQEIAGLFLGMGALAALFGGLSPQKAVDAFLAGAQDVLVAALVIGFARGLLVLLEDGAIIDTLLHWLAMLADGFAPELSVVAMFGFQTILNFFVPSGSAQAALTMPLMAPLSDLLGVGRQSAVLAFQFGDGFSSLIIPTSGITMGSLELAKIPYDRWLRFAVPLVLLLSAVGAVLLVISLYAF